MMTVFNRIVLSFNAVLGFDTDRIWEVESKSTTLVTHSEHRARDPTSMRIEACVSLRSRKHPTSEVAVETIWRETCQLQSQCKAKERDI